MSRHHHGAVVVDPRTVEIIDIVLHLDAHLQAWSEQFGVWVYVLLFLVIFCETGLIVMPFLPGDSLLFAIGVLTAGNHPALDVKVILVSLIIAAILGDSVNYATGNYIGPRVFQKPDSRWFKRAHLVRTQQFFEKYGGKTIVMARFVPIVRTFAPFLAGVGKMTYARFAMFNVVGAFVWVCSLVLAGHFFGNVPIVKNNFSAVVLGIVVLSVLPIAIDFIRRKPANAAP
jgi:membrane-associated protein